MAQPSGAIRDANLDVLHHALILMVENAAMQHILANADDEPVIVCRWILQHWIAAELITVEIGLDEDRVVPDALEAGELIIVVACAGRTGLTDIFPGRVKDCDDLERIDMDMKGMTDAVRTQLPLLRPAQYQGAIDTVGIVGGVSLRGRPKMN